jgi:hypothetical protein
MGHVMCLKSRFCVSIQNINFLGGKMLFKQGYLRKTKFLSTNCFAGKRLIFGNYLVHFVPKIEKISVNLSKKR